MVRPTIVPAVATHDDARRTRPRRHGVSLMASPVTAAPTDRDAFLEAVRAADILTPNQQAKATAVAPAGSAAGAAAALVAAGLVTRFQADRLLAGRTDGFIVGPYVVLDQVGRGAMSRVYKAKHRTMHRPVAIKVLSSGLTRTAAERAALQRAVRAAGKLTHPNIVTAYDASELHDRFYLVLEFVDGPSLDALVRQRGPLPVAEACEFVRQTAVGLQHALDMGMVHGDIKPANLLVARPTPAAPLTVKIADYGVPKAVRGPTDFAAPAGETDRRADLYSLGGAFYFLLTGRPPHRDHPGAGGAGAAGRAAGSGRGRPPPAGEAPGGAVRVGGGTAGSPGRGVRAGRHSDGRRGELRRAGVPGPPRPGQRLPDRPQPAVGCPHGRRVAVGADDRRGD